MRPLLYLWGWYNGECVHDTVRVLLTNLADEQSSHAGSSATSEGVGQLEALQTIAALGLLADHIEDGVDQLSALRVVSLRPVVTGSALAENEIVWTEDLTEWSGPHGVHCSWFKVDQDGSWNVLST